MSTVRAKCPVYVALLDWIVRTSDVNAVQTDSLTQVRSNVLRVLSQTPGRGVAAGKAATAQ
jgi:hypothetical protein